MTKDDRDADLIKSHDTTADKFSPQENPWRQNNADLF